ncbi:MAG: hypothetical protein ACYSTJ_03410 [Planctomycetota bacterium]
MGSDNRDKRVFHACIGKSQELISLIEYSADSIVSQQDDTG